MNRLIKLALAVAGVVILSACAPKGPDTSAVTAQMKADQSQWAMLYNKGDTQAIAKQYADDAMLMPANDPAVSGRDAIAKFLTSDIAKMKKDGVTLETGAVTGTGVSGDLAWISGNWTAKNASGGVADKGKYLTVYQQTNGQWLIIRDTWNSDQRPPTPAPPAAPTTSPETPAAAPSGD